VAIWKISGQSEELDSVKDRASNKPIGVGSKSSLFKGSQWGMCGWADMQEELVSGPYQGPRWETCRLADICCDLHMVYVHE